MRAPRPSDFPTRLLAIADPREPEAVRYVVETRLLTYELEEDLVQQARKRQDTPLHRWVARLVGEGVEPEAIPLKEPKWLSVEGARAKLRRDGHPVLPDNDDELPLGDDPEATGLYVLAEPGRPGVIRYVGETSDPIAFCASDHVNAALRKANRTHEMTPLDRWVFDLYMGNTGTPGEGAAEMLGGHPSEEPERDRGTRTRSKPVARSLGGFDSLEHARRFLLDLGYQLLQGE